MNVHSRMTVMVITRAVKPRSATPRQQVMDAALNLFAERGYFNTSIPDLVGASGVSTGSIYHHFGDKEGVAKALFDSTVERMEKALEDICQQHPTTKARCRAIIKMLFAITESEPELMKFMLHAKHREFLPEVAPICSSSPFRLMRSLVADGMKTGEVIEMDETVAAAAVFGAAIRLIQMRLDSVIEQALFTYQEETWICSWRAIASNPG